MSESETGLAVIPSDPVALREYMRGLADSDPDTAGASALAGLDPRTLVPILRMNKPAPNAQEGTWDLRMNGQSLWPSPPKKVSFVVLGVYAQRTLFAPGTIDEHKTNGLMRPVCGVSYAPQDSVINGTSTGRWYGGTDEHSFDPPPHAISDRSGAVYVSCKTCPWAPFESQGVWDPAKAGSRAPACGRNRLLFVALVKEVMKLPTVGEDEYSLFGPDPLFQERFAVLSLSFATNDRSYKELVSAWRAKSGSTGVATLRLPQTVFTCKVGKTQDAYGNPVMQSAVAGMVIPPYWRETKEERIPAMDQFVADARARGGEFVSEHEWEPLPEPSLRPTQGEGTIVDVPVHTEVDPDGSLIVDGVKLF